MKGYTKLHLTPSPRALLVLGMFLAVGVLGGSSSSDSYQAYNDVAPIPGSGRSDMTATLFEGSLFPSGKARIYLVGGCVQDQQCPPSSFCVCPAITSGCNYYEPETDVWSPCANAPRDRYRHAAANVGGKLYLFGGRTVSDSIIQEVDIFDPIANSWSVRTNPWTGATSDLTAFVEGNVAYLVGGWSSTYSPIDALTLYTPIADIFGTGPVMPGGGRGDIAAVSVVRSGQTRTSHFIIGGFGPSGFCDPLQTVQEYNTATSAWTSAADLILGRADMAVGSIGSHVFAIAGENPDSTCTSTNSGVADPVNDVERMTDAGQWAVEDPIPSDRFRFVAASFERTIYIFGGQGPLNRATTPPTHHVLATTTRYVPTTVHNEDLSGEQIAGVVIGAIAAAAAIVLGVIAFFSYKKYKSYKGLTEEAAAADATENEETAPAFDAVGVGSTDTVVKVDPSSEIPDEVTQDQVTVQMKSSETAETASTQI